jgi:hypothetical protein
MSPLVCMRFLIYPLIFPVVSALVFSPYHWEKFSSELIIRNIKFAYILMLVPSLIVAAVDIICLRRNVEERPLWCIVIAVVVTVLPMCVLVPGLLVEGPALIMEGVSSVVATLVCYGISNRLAPMNGASDRN